MPISLLSRPPPNTSPMASSSPSLRDLLAQELSHAPKPRSRPSSATPKPPPPPSDLNHRPAPPRAAAAAAFLPVSGDDDDLPVDAEAARAVTAILSGYAGRFLKDPSFRRGLRAKCAAATRQTASADPSPALANLELAVDSVERLADEWDAPPRAVGDAKVRSLRSSVRLLGVVASLAAAPRARAARTGGVPNAHLAACAHLYLSIIYKIERNDPVSARHLLQVFFEAPYLARKSLLPDLWDHFFLPHLLHLKIWYTKEVEIIRGWGSEDGDHRIKSLKRAYNDQMDVGTAQFALYYKEWLKVGAFGAPPLPSVPLPSRPAYAEPLWNRSASLSRGSISRSLYRAVFGPEHEEDIGDRELIDEISIVGKRDLGSKESRFSLGNLVHSDTRLQVGELKQSEGNPAPEAAPTPRKSYSFRLLSCRSDLNVGAIHSQPNSKQESTRVAGEPENDEQITTLERAIALISKSDDLKKCESAVRVIAKAWLYSRGDSTIEIALFSSSLIEGLLEVAFTSKDEEVLELAISILAELVSKNEVNRQVVLNADPQLEIFLRLFGTKKLFLKAAVVLHLIKPKAKQMLSLDWIPLVLRVLDYGDQIQTLFNVKCSPKAAAFYFLDQLLMGFDVDRNVENAKQMVALGGLDLLMKRFEMGNARERRSCGSLLAACIRAEGRCRHFLADNIKKESIVQLLMGNQLKSSGSALSLLSELLCLNRPAQIIKFLKELKSNGCLNTMHVLLVYLQQAPIAQRPVAAAILLQLDLLGDHLQYSVYREEGIDAIIAALEQNLLNKKMQEQCARALSLLAMRFSCSGKAMTEAWLLMRAGLDDSPEGSFRKEEIFGDKNARMEEEKVTEEWLKKLATILLTSGNKRLLVALSNCIAEGIPKLARSCLVTVAWLSNSLSLLNGCSNTFQPLACSILAPRLFECLSYDRALEERVLASLSLLNFARHPECLPKLFPMDKETVTSLRDLAEVTWTAKELLFACCR